MAARVRFGSRRQAYALPKAGTSTALQSHMAGIGQSESVPHKDQSAAESVGNAPKTPCDPMCSQQSSEPENFLKLKLKDVGKFHCREIPLVTSMQLWIAPQLIQEQVNNDRPSRSF